MHPPDSGSSPLPMQRSSPKSQVNVDLTVVDEDNDFSRASTIETISSSSQLRTVVAVFQLCGVNFAWSASVKRPLYTPKPPDKYFAARLAESIENTVRERTEATPEAEFATNVFEENYQYLCEQLHRHFRPRQLQQLRESINDPKYWEHEAKCYEDISVSKLGKTLRASSPQHTVTPTTACDRRHVIHSHEDTQRDLGVSTREMECFRLHIDSQGYWKIEVELLQPLSNLQECELMNQWRREAKEDKHLLNKRALLDRRMPRVSVPSESVMGETNATTDLADAVLFLGSFTGVDDITSLSDNHRTVRLVDKGLCLISSASFLVWRPELNKTEQRRYDEKALEWSKEVIASVATYFPPLNSQHETVTANIRYGKNHAVYVNEGGVEGRGMTASVMRVRERTSGLVYGAKEPCFKVSGDFGKPHIVEVIELVITEDKKLSPWLIMEHIPRSLQPGDLNEQGTLSILIQVSSALLHMHSEGISHRDVKPDNILIQDSKPIHAKLADSWNCETNYTRAHGYLRWKSHLYGPRISQSSIVLYQQSRYVLPWSARVAVPYTMGSTIGRDMVP
ncbi:calcium calmodulin-dependent kinase type IV [Fusarium heterosporum]|uniref:Calcium calmodulin-dependent kinase type IV n=1 Tax=Fusarium heterosporum TaxID=42747 RepID=A0A8H5T6M0_FUSHE|nr:calcium calmodulin-dependent kinase type IV [Fusarium heterosporum]